MRKSQKNSTTTTAGSLLVESEVLPTDIYNAYISGISDIEKGENELLFYKYTNGELTLTEFRIEVFNKIKTVETALTHLCGYFVSDLPNKDSIIDRLLNYACVFMFFHKDITVVINNIHNKAFNLAMNDSKINNEVDYLGYVENYLSTLTPKLTKIKEAIKQYTKS